MRKYLLHILIISFVFILAPTAHVASHAGELEDAKEKVRIDPDDAWAHNDLGCVYDDLGKYQEAIKSFKQAIRLDPDNAAAHFNLGYAYGMLGKYEEEIEAYKQAIRIYPDFASAHLNLGVAYLFLNDRGSALEQYKILKKLDTEKANKLFNEIYSE